ncbi:hypothetical protein IM792_19015 [Mucilaginibacter sp. JRF]|uniref:uracil-DNA glycosylase family protein n=1 Tax=Mucilaginibacter sp. JRF TaxID=2780088 RepID=UPI00188051BD|nr:uracil-DNA glycosylase family protein [Mucilaginibacter sp. JRF]MBE9586547.1 hypothetical protein [Mucilaginibacter sp. JRF]
MEFCNFSTTTINGIVTAFEKTFSIDRSAFVASYSFFCDCFENTDAHLSYVMPHLNRSQIQPITNDSLFITKYNDTNYYLGIDLPIYISKPGNIKNVVVVAEDPLRNPADPLISASKEYALLGTPFATHLESMRRALKEYWDFHHELLNNGFNVYITDINKIWLKATTGTKENIPGDLAEGFKQTLQAEINLLQPDLLVVYGKKAANAIDSMELQISAKRLMFPHPSRTANGTWKKLFSTHYPNVEKNCSSINKVAYMIEKTLAI